MRHGLLKVALACAGASVAHGVAAEEALSISTDMKSVSTFSSVANPVQTPKDPVAAARTAFNMFDYTVARKAWEPLAAEGHADAQYGLYQIYSRGLLVDPDQDLAMRWLRLAARQAHPAAHFYLGLSYLRGEGLEKDLAQAWVWFSRAEAAQFPTAARARDSVEKRLTPEQLAAARKRLAQ
jgi:TPR repeat protein